MHISELRICTVQKMFPADLVTFTEEILNGKLHFLSSVVFSRNIKFKGNTQKLAPNENTSIFVIKKYYKLPFYKHQKRNFKKKRK